MTTGEFFIVVWASTCVICALGVLLHGWLWRRLNRYDRPLKRDGWTR